MRRLLKLKENYKDLLLNVLSSKLIDLLCEITESLKSTFSADELLDCVVDIVNNNESYQWLLLMEFYTPITLDSSSVYDACDTLYQKLLNVCEEE